MTDTTLGRDTVAVEAVLRDAGRRRRRVRARFRYQGETGPMEYERTWEPYTIADDKVTVYSSLMNGFRSIPLRDITHVELLDDEFRPRVDVSL